jgi:hypothetical protein
MPAHAFHPVMAAAVRPAVTVAEHAPPVVPMLLIGFVWIATFVAIAFELLRKTVVALLGAIGALRLALGPGVYDGENPYEMVHRFRMQALVRESCNPVLVV